MPYHGHVRLSFLVAALVAVHPLHADAQSAENVAVVINEASPASQKIGEHYIRVRAIPPENVIRLRTDTDESIERAEYVRSIEQPIVVAIANGNLHDRILYIVLTKDIPLRIAGTAGTDGSIASVDSELTLLYRRMTGQTVPTRGRIANPYFLGDKPIAQAQPFTHRALDIFLVSRLDAFTVDEAIALIDRAQSPSREGRVVLDERAALVSDGTGDRWLAEAAKRLTAAGQGERVVLEETTRGARDVDGVLGYYSWGSNDEANRVRRYGMKFVPGAIAATFVSSDGRTLQNPPDSWMPTSDWNDKKAWFGGSPQSLIGDLIRDGATGVAGHVAEPYLQSTVRPEILFPAYFAGFNLIEAFYLALPHVSWQAIVIGDPLCAPFRKSVLTRAEIEADRDAATELPGLFSKRRLETMQASFQASMPGVSSSAVSLILLAESRNARGDKAGARKALEEATAAAPNLTIAQLQLGMMDEQAGNYEAAAERYRVVLKTQPNSVLALNNLAYHIAVRGKMPGEALPLARRAVALQPENASILDTLGWIEHLLGNDESAVKSLAQAAKLAPTLAEARFHAAIVFGALGALPNARAELAEALKLNPSLATHEETLKLQQRLKALKN